MSKKFATLDKIQQLVEKKDVGKSFVFMSDDDDIKVVNDENDFYFIRNKREYKLPDYSFKSMFRAFGIPHALIGKLNEYPELVAYNLNYMMNEKPSSMRALVRNKRIIGVNDPRNTIISNRRVLNQIENAMGKDALIDKYNIMNDGSMDISITTEPSDKTKYEVDKGDYFNPGVHISNSPIKGESTSIESYLMRLVCSNGAIGYDSVYRAPKTIDTDANQWLHYHIDEAQKYSFNLFEGIKKLREQEITGDPAVFMMTIFDDLNISSTLRDKIMSRVEESETKNMYDAFNHITYVASHHEDIRNQPNARNRLMRLSTHYSEHVQDICNACARPTHNIPVAQN